MFLENFSKIGKFRSTPRYGPILRCDTNFGFIEIGSYKPRAIVSIYRAIFSKIYSGKCDIETKSLSLMNSF